MEFQNVQSYWYRLTVVTFSQYNIFLYETAPILLLSAFCMMISYCLVKCFKALASLPLRFNFTSFSLSIGKLSSIYQFYFNNTKIFSNNLFRDTLS